MARPAGIKPNSEEAAQALGQPVSSDAEHVAAARRLVDLLAPATPPAPIVCLTRGARGLVLAAGGELVAAEPPPVLPRSPVGAGDATLAGCCGRCPTAAMRPRWRAAPWRAARPRRCRRGRVWGRGRWSMSCGRRSRLQGCRLIDYGPCGRRVEPNRVTQNLDAADKFGKNLVIWAAILRVVRVRVLRIKMLRSGIPELNSNTPLYSHARDRHALHCFHPSHDRRRYRAGFHLSRSRTRPACCTPRPPTAP